MTTYFVVPLNSLRIGTKSKREFHIVVEYFSTFVNFGNYGGQRFPNSRNGDFEDFWNHILKLVFLGEFYNWKQIFLYVNRERRTLPYRLFHWTLECDFIYNMQNVGILFSLAILSTPWGIKGTCYTWYTCWYIFKGFIKTLPACIIVGIPRTFFIF